MDSDISIILDIFHKKKDEQKTILTNELLKCSKSLEKITLNLIAETLTYDKIILNREIPLYDVNYSDKHEWIKKRVLKKIDVYIEHLNKKHKYFFFTSIEIKNNKGLARRIYIKTTHPLAVYMTEQLDPRLYPIVPIIMKYYVESNMPVKKKARA